jgi:hypothetical protein
MIDIDKLEEGVLIEANDFETFFKEPEKWDEMGVFSKTEPVEVRITKKGGRHLSTL